MRIIAQDIDIRPYGHGTYQIIATDKFNPVSVEIAVDGSDLLKLKEMIDGVLKESQLPQR